MELVWLLIVAFQIGGLAAGIACFFCWLLMIKRIWAVERGVAFIYLALTLVLIGPLLVFLHGLRRANEWRLERLLTVWTVCFAVSWLQTLSVLTLRTAEITQAAYFKGYLAANLQATGLEIHTPRFGGIFQNDPAMQSSIKLTPDADLQNEDFARGYRAGCRDMRLKMPNESTNNQPQPAQSSTWSAGDGNWIRATLPYLESVELQKQMEPKKDPVSEEEPREQ